MYRRDVSRNDHAQADRQHQPTVRRKVILPMNRKRKLQLLAGVGASVAVA